MAELRRRRSLDVGDFIAEHLRPRIPVVVTDEVVKWPACNSWTWDRLVEWFGDREVDLYDDGFIPTGTTTFADFVAGTITANTRDPRRSYVRWYARNTAGDGRWADDVFATLANDWSQPSFLPDSGFVVPFVTPPARVNAVSDPFPYRAFFISARGARTRLHLDPWTSSAILCQVTGTKRVYMYPPESHELMLDIAIHGDEARLKTITPAFDDVLNAGEVLLIPSGWWHHVSTLSDSISLTWNFVHASMAEDLRKHIAADPDDSELAVVDYMLSCHQRADRRPAHGVAAAVEEAIAAQDPAGGT